MDAQVSGPYIAKKINLGSGPRERASSCSCNYRTSQRRQSSSSYISLKEDPIMISYEKQWYRRSTAPLVQALNREAFCLCNEKIHRRAASAKLRTQSNNSEKTKQRIGNVMQVQGKTIACQQRPNTEKKTTDDHAIKSVQDATAEHLTLTMFDLHAYSNLIAPCPSPEPSEEGAEVGQAELTCKPLSEMSNERVCPSPSSSLEVEAAIDRNRDLSGCNVVKPIKDLYETRPGYLEEEVRNVSQTSNKNENDQGNDFVFSIPIPKAHMDFPEIPDVVDNSHSVPYRSSPAEIDSTIHQRFNTHMNAKSPKILRDKRRCSSASSVLRFNVKCKSFEFLTEKDLCGAQFNISKNPREILCNNLPTNKSALPKHKSNNNERSNAVNKEEVPRKKSIGSGVPLEIQIPSNILPKKRQPHVAAISNDTPKMSSHATGKIEKSTEVLAPRKVITWKVNMPAIRLLHRAGKDLFQRRATKQNGPGVIWRNISGIDLQKKESDIDDKANHMQLDSPKCQVNISSSPRVCSQDLESDGVKNETVEVVSDTEKGNATSMKPCIKDNWSVGKSDGDEHQGDSHKRERKIRFAESDNDRIIRRPTSAVIQRYLEMTRQNRAGPTDESTQSKLMKRPVSGNKASVSGKRASVSGKRASVSGKRASVSGNRASVNRGKRTGGRIRCSSATGLKSPNQYSKSAKSTVVSGESLDLKPTNRQVQLATRQGGGGYGKLKEGSTAKLRKEPVELSLSPRPKSAPAKACVLDVIEEEENISKECSKVMDACRKKGINVSMDTLKRALMPPSEFAKPYSRYNMPHPSRLLSNGFQWSDRHTRTNR